MKNHSLVSLCIMSALQLASAVEVPDAPSPFPLFPADLPSDWWRGNPVQVEPPAVLDSETPTRGNFYVRGRLDTYVNGDVFLYGRPASDRRDCAQVPPETSINDTFEVFQYNAKDTTLGNRFYTLINRGKIANVGYSVLNVNSPSNPNPRCYGAVINYGSINQSGVTPEYAAYFFHNAAEGVVQTLGLPEYFVNYGLVNTVHNNRQVASAVHNSGTIDHLQVRNSVSSGNNQFLGNAGLISHAEVGVTKHPEMGWVWGWNSRLENTGTLTVDVWHSMREARVFNSGVLRIMDVPLYDDSLGGGLKSEFQGKYNSGLLEMVFSGTVRTLLLHNTGTAWLGAATYSSPTILNDGDLDISRARFAESRLELVNSTSVALPGTIECGLVLRNTARGSFASINAGGERTLNLARYVGILSDHGRVWGTPVETKPQEVILDNQGLMVLHNVSVSGSLYHEGATVWFMQWYGKNNYAEIYNSGTLLTQHSPDYEVPAVHMTKIYNDGFIDFGHTRVGGDMVIQGSGTIRLELNPTTGSPWGDFENVGTPEVKPVLQITAPDGLPSGDIKLFTEQVASASAPPHFTLDPEILAHGAPQPLRHSLASTVEQAPGAGRNYYRVAWWLRSPAEKFRIRADVNLTQ